MKSENYSYRDGLKDGIPIALGYLFVSIGFGIAAVNSRLSVLTSVFISLTNLTSAGQFAGVKIINDMAVFMTSAIEMFVSELVINARYSLMAISMSQKLDDSFTSSRRLIGAFFITDEIFAVSISKEHRFSFRYLLGLGTLPLIGWSTGTAIGALTASFMPAELSSIFSMAIYGMFISIVVPVSIKEKEVLAVCVLAVVFSSGLYFFTSISTGFSIVISALLSSVIIAWIKTGKENR